MIDPFDIEEPIFKETPKKRRGSESALSELLACTLQWIPVNDCLPLRDLDAVDKPYVFGNYLVCVEHDMPDKHDEKQITILEFHARDNRWWSDGVPYNWGWHVTHWAELPEPPK